MSKVFVLLWMLFNHVLDDYFLQGILANMKQKRWWEDNASDRMYRYDYIMALTMHSISWAFMIMLPIAWWMNYSPGWLFLYMFLVNVVLHMVVDNEKANRRTINLVVDQLCHAGQIGLTFAMLVA